MSKVLVIPDVHLKAGMFDRAEKILDEGQADFAVQLGDLVDDWDMQYAVSYYNATMERVIAFHEKFPKTYWCMGNHDFGYYHPEYGRRETGHSKLMEEEMAKRIKALSDAGIVQMVAHLIDNVLFSHAGITEEWVDELRQAHATAAGELSAEAAMPLINFAAPAELWHGNSPIWVRPQENYNGLTGTPMPHAPKMWRSGECLQVVGHTPMRKVTRQGSLLSTDVFSTHSNGAPYGEERFVIVDTEDKTWEYAEEDR